MEKKRANKNVNRTTITTVTTLFVFTSLYALYLPIIYHPHLSILLVAVNAQRSADVNEQRQQNHSCELEKLHRAV